jgi:death-on-curing family protein
MKKEVQKSNKGEIIIYQDKADKISIDVKFDKNNVWLNQMQIAELFGTQRPAITKHLRNIFKDGELKEKSVCSILEHTAADGKTYKTAFYNLDAIISVGYRVNSRKATSFRIWATNKLKDYLIKGYAINQKRLKEGELKNIRELGQVFISVKKILEAKQLKMGEAEGILKIITDYANSWVLLQKYDEGSLSFSSNQKKVEGDIDFDTAFSAIEELKKSLVEKKEAGDLFGKNRGEMFRGILGNLNQSFSGKELYPTVEARAAHLLYFIIKDHPFFDGNKRIGSFLFILFLKKNNYFLKKNGERKIDENGLVTLALLVAQSNPKDKEGIIKLIINFLKN